METMNLAAKTIHASTAIHNVSCFDILRWRVLNHFTHVLWASDSQRRGESPFFTLKCWLYRNATDPLDKVYALMGLFPDKTFSKVPSYDYELSPATLYTRITCGLIQAKRSLRSLIGQRGELKETEGLPT